MINYIQYKVCSFSKRLNDKCKHILSVSSDRKGVFYCGSTTSYTACYIQRKKGRHDKSAVANNEPVNASDCDTVTSCSCRLLSSEVK